MKKLICAAPMSDFEWWFLLVYTVYTVISILGLMWVGREQQHTPDQTSQSVTAATYWSSK